MKSSRKVCPRATRLFELGLIAHGHLLDHQRRLKELDTDEAIRRAAFEEVAAGRGAGFYLSFERGKAMWARTWALARDWYAELEAIQTEMAQIARNDLSLGSKDLWYVTRPTAWVDWFRSHGARSFAFGFSDPFGPSYQKFSTLLRQLEREVGISAASLEKSLAYWAALYGLDGPEVKPLLAPFLRHHEDRHA